jgi:hypothetical protein
MLILLGSLIRVFMLLEIGRRAASSTEKLLVHLTFSIYLGWITVATIANLTQVLYFLKWDGFGINDTAWAFVLLAAAVAIGAWMAFSRGVPAYLAVLVWAVVGVGVRNAANPALMIGSYAAALILAALMVKAFFPTRKTA